jgi:8-oxo-dGTP diphosphatase
MWDGSDFSGTKVALLHGTDTVAYLRDEKPGIPFPGLWDLPGGGRENGEGPVECGLREVEEEFGLSLDPGSVLLIERHRSRIGGLDTYFCAMQIGDDDVARIRFGDEGQCWTMMPIREFVTHARAIPHLQYRLGALMDSGRLDMAAIPAPGGA